MLPGELKKYINANPFLKANEWFRPLGLNYIALESDANHFYYIAQKMYLDTENDIIKIKHYNLIQISQALTNFSYNPTSKQLFFSNGGNYIASGRYTPKSGDIVGCYDPSTNLTTLCAIATNTSDYNSNTRLTLVNNDATDAFFTKIQSIRVPTKFFVFPGEYLRTAFSIKADKPYELFIEKPLTTFEADEYISTDKVVGFDYGSRWGL